MTDQISTEQVAERGVKKFMSKVGSTVVAVARFLAISLAIDVALFIIVTLSCFIGTRCTNVMYSERMFWSGMAAMVAAMPAVLAGLGTHQGNFGDPFLAGQQMRVADAIIKDARLQLSKRSAFAWRAATVGAGAMLISALIDLIGR